jgi:chorismate dehydratase
VEPGSAAPRVGCVRYLNAHPLWEGLPWPLQFDHPSVLCRRLAAGELDVALVSSFEFLRNPIYAIVDDVAIAADGAVYSVFVASKTPNDFEEIELDPASATAVSLLRCLWREQGRQFREGAPPANNLSPLTNGRARLLIGDQAIRFRQKFGDQYEYLDLGEAWRDRMALPFVFALWLIRPEVENAGFIADQLRQTRDRNLARLDHIVAQQSEFSAEFCTRYYRENLSFQLHDREKAGLRLFGDLCAKQELLPGGSRNLRLV